MVGALFINVACGLYNLWMMWRITLVYNALLAVAVMAWNARHWPLHQIILDKEPPEKDRRTKHRGE